MVSKQKNVARLERKQHKADAGLMSTRYPNVASVIIFMNYYQKSTGRTIMQRTVNFLPGSSAYFHMECMGYDCVDGGFNLEPVINTMMKGRLKSGKGELLCAGNDSSSHTRIDYKIDIQYNKTSR
ncbi:MAG: hypothetical protein M1147_00110 [Nitrospirae bacterium]|nr:hypothetical protein [Nitrospirota bacterium]MCL5976515.1 hypothetical protein [Nitrospirota bacterium]